MKTQEKTFNLNLTSWQKRLAQDFLKLKTPVDAVSIKPGPIQCPASYKIPVEGLSHREWLLYLTDEQMKTVQEEFDLAAPVSGIIITDGMIKKGDVKFYERTFKLELAPWQRRMAKDFLDSKSSYRTVMIKPGVILCPASYKIPVKGLSIRDWLLYLTDEQMKTVQGQFDLAESVSGINITDEQIERGEVMFQ